LDGFKVLLEMFLVRNQIQEYWWGCLVGHPYIASLWLGFSICEALKPKRVLGSSLALFCLLPGYFQAFGFSVNKGVQRSFCYLRTHSRVKMGSMLYKAFCLVYHGSHPNNREHICAEFKFLKVPLRRLPSPGGWEILFKIRLNYSNFYSLCKCFLLHPSSALFLSYSKLFEFNLLKQVSLAIFAGVTFLENLRSANIKTDILA
jgi:hypothetical protein